MEQFCYKHKNVKAEISCHYCGKAYCKSCLRLHGRRKIVICEDCFETFKTRIEKSTIRRIIYAILGVVMAFPLLYQGYESYVMEDGNSYLFFIVGVGCIVSTVVNIIRIRQCKEFLVVEEYNK